MWSKFPKLRHIEIRSLSHIEPILFKNFLFWNESSAGLKQIKTLSNSLEKGYYFLNKSITLNKSNAKLGIWVGDRIVACKANKACILCPLSQWVLIDSSFDINQKFLIMKWMHIQFSLEELRIDEDWEEKEQEYYSNIFIHYSEENPDSDSILFIVQVYDISIPQNVEDIEMNLNISINDYRPIYSLGFSRREASKELENYIDTISDQSLVEVSFMWSKQRMYFGHSKNWKFKIRPWSKENISLLESIWKKLLSK